MRIIAGEHRGRRIEAPPGLSTRPMLDRVREALFSTLAPWLSEARVLDLFAGSGSLGLEALSRGARSVRFVEDGAVAVRVLERNLSALGLAGRAEIVRADALDGRAWRPADEPGPDVAFLDPPYGLVRDPGGRARVLGAVVELATRVLASEGVLCLHVPRELLHPQDFPDGLEVRERDYGTSALFYVQPAGAEESGAGAPTADAGGEA